jgi:hypothetical protein
LRLCGYWFDAFDIHHYRGVCNEKDGDVRERTLLTSFNIILESLRIFENSKNFSVTPSNMAFANAIAVHNHDAHGIDPSYSRNTVPTFTEKVGRRGCKRGDAASQ